jgi:hypothetical protein
VPIAIASLGAGAIDDEDRRALARELTPEERLLWAAHPHRGLLLTGADLYMIPLSLFWCGFSIFWEMRALASQKVAASFPLFGIPFLAIGLYLVVGRFFGDAVRRKRTFYGLTARRIIIVAGIFSRQVKSIELGALGETSLSERADGSGTITLGQPGGPNGWAFTRMGPSWPGASRTLPPMLEAIDNARGVYQKIRAVSPGVAAGS